MPRRFDDDDDFDRPRPKRGKKSNALYWVIGGVTFAVCCGFILCGTILYFVFVLKEKPAPPAAAVAPLPAPVVAGVPLPAPVGVAVPAAVPQPFRFTAPPTQLLFAGGDTGAVASVGYAPAGPGYVADVCRLLARSPVGTVRIPKSTINALAVAPDGAYFAAVGSDPFHGDPVAVYAVAGGNAVLDFKPYPRSPQTLTQVPGLIWVVLLPGDRLLTLNEWGGYDVWSLPGGLRLYGRAGNKEGNLRVGFNGFTKLGSNFAMTPDARSLAVFDGRGFVVCDPTTGAETWRTPDVAGPNESMNFWGAALTADGSRLAFLGSKGGTFLTVWDAATGRADVNLLLPAANSAAGISWWGKNHLLFHQGGISSADVIEVATGRKVATLSARPIGKLGPTGPGDRAWAAVGTAFVDAEIPAGFPAGTEFHLTADGLTRR